MSLDGYAHKPYFYTNHSYSSPLIIRVFWQIYKFIFHLKGWISLYLILKMRMKNRMRIKHLSSEVHSHFYFESHSFQIMQYCYSINRILHHRCLQFLFIFLVNFQLITHYCRYCHTFVILFSYTHIASFIFVVHLNK